jgi:hypothetical protein
MRPTENTRTFLRYLVVFCGRTLEAGSGIEPLYEDLQSSA